MKRLIQFRLRSMFVACAMLGLFVGWLGNAVHQFRFEQSTVENLMTVANYRGSTLRIRLSDRNAFDPTMLM